RPRQDHPARGAAEHPGGAVRSGANRRRFGLADLPPHHRAGARTGVVAGQYSHHGGLFSAVRRAVRDDGGRAAAEHAQRAVLHVRRGVQVVEPGTGLRRRIPALHSHVHRYTAPASDRPTGGACMKRTPAVVAVNAILLFAAVVTVFPLFWMLSVSFMPSGAASTYPPPLLPDAPTLENYRELFAGQAAGRYLFNSAVVATLATIISLTFNTMAGYAFAKLRFRGRDRIFQALLGALVIPAQVTLIPLFALVKEL